MASRESSNPLVGQECEEEPALCPDTGPPLAGTLPADFANQRRVDSTGEGPWENGWDFVKRKGRSGLDCLGCCGEAGPCEALGQLAVGRCVRGARTCVCVDTFFEAHESRAMAVAVFVHYTVLQLYLAVGIRGTCRFSANGVPLSNVEIFAQLGLAVLAQTFGNSLWAYPRAACAALGVVFAILLVNHWAYTQLPFCPRADYPSYVATMIPFGSSLAVLTFQLAGCARSSALAIDWACCGEAGLIASRRYHAAVARERLRRWRAGRKPVVCCDGNCGCVTGDSLRCLELLEVATPGWVPSHVPSSLASDAADDLSPDKSESRYSPQLALPGVKHPMTAWERAVTVMDSEVFRCGRPGPIDRCPNTRLAAGIVTALICSIVLITLPFWYKSHLAPQLNDLLDQTGAELLVAAAAQIETASDAPIQPPSVPVINQTDIAKQLLLPLARTVVEEIKLVNVGAARSLVVGGPIAAILLIALQVWNAVRWGQAIRAILLRGYCDYSTGAALIELDRLKDYTGGSRDAGSDKGSVRARGTSGVDSTVLVARKEAEDQGCSHGQREHVISQSAQREDKAGLLAYDRGNAPVDAASIARSRSSGYGASTGDLAYPATSPHSHPIAGSTENPLLGISLAASGPSATPSQQGGPGESPPPRPDELQPEAQARRLDPDHAAAPTSKLDDGSTAGLLSADVDIERPQVEEMVMSSQSWCPCCSPSCIRCMQVSLWTMSCCFVCFRVMLHPKEPEYVRWADADDGSRAVLLWRMHKGRQLGRVDAQGSAGDCGVSVAAVPGVSPVPGTDGNASAAARRRSSTGIELSSRWPSSGEPVMAKTRGPAAKAFEGSNPARAAAPGHGSLEKHHQSVVYWLPKRWTADPLLTGLSCFCCCIDYVRHDCAAMGCPWAQLPPVREEVDRAVFMKAQGMGEYEKLPWEARDDEEGAGKDSLTSPKHRPRRATRPSDSHGGRGQSQLRAEDGLAGFYTRSQTTKTPEQRLAHRPSTARQEGNAADGHDYQHGVTTAQGLCENGHSSSYGYRKKTAAARLVEKIKTKERPQTVVDDDGSVRVRRVVLPSGVLGDADLDQYQYYFTTSMTAQYFASNVIVLVLLAAMVSLLVFPFAYDRTRAVALVLLRDAAIVAVLNWLGKRLLFRAWLVMPLRIRNARVFLAIEGLYSLTLGLAAGFVSGAARMGIAVLWAAIQSARLDIPRFPGMLRQADVGFTAYAAVVRARMYVNTHLLDGGLDK